MKPNQLLGIIKFFNNEEYLFKLIGGLFHCTPPEVYRLEKREGISDRLESCMYSYRVDRGEKNVSLKFNELDISDAVAITFQQTKHKDSWMHCWFSLRVPKDEESLVQLNSDIDKMKKEFGSKTAFIPAEKIKPFIWYLHASSSKPLYCGFVEYSEDPHKWNSLCKSMQYAYQREYRFLFGECSVHEVEPYVIYGKQGFGEYIYRGESLKLTSKNRENIWLDLGA